MGDREPVIEVKAWWLRALIGRRPLRTLVRLGVITVVTLLLFRVLLIPIKVMGASMEPSYRDGRVNLINRMAYRRHGPNRGDVVGIQTPKSRVLILKRVLGLPGENILLRDGRVAVDGEFLEENYVGGVGLSRETQSITLGEGEFFVIGDNRAVTVYGRVTMSEIRGKVVF